MLREAIPKIQENGSPEKCEDKSNGISDIAVESYLELSVLLDGL